MTKARHFPVDSVPVLAPSASADAGVPDHVLLVRAGPRCRLGGLVGLALGAVVVGHGSAWAQSGTVGMTPPSCGTYQRERPRGGPWEQLSDLFGLSIYRWSEMDYGRYRTLLLDCKRSLPGFR